MSVTRNVTVTYDKATEAVYLKVSDASVASTSELASDIFVDFDLYGQIVGVELLLGMTQRRAGSRADVTARRHAHRHT